MRQTTPITNECTPAKKAIHMELRHQLNEKKRLMNETDYEHTKGTIDLKEKTRRYAQIVLEYNELLKQLHKTSN